MNMRTLISRYNRLQQNDKLSKAVNNLKSTINNLSKAQTLNTLLGLEGVASREYFGVFNLLIKEDVPFNFKTRNRRPPQDPVNALLGYGYTLLAKDLISSAQVVGFDSYIGFLHRSDYGRPALALDLMEEFRPIIVDSVVLKLLNKRTIKEEDFHYDLGGCYLNNTGRKKLYRAYEERRREEVTHPVFGYRIPYYRIFELQARFLAKVLQGELKEYQPFLVR